MSRAGILSEIMKEIEVLLKSAKIVLYLSKLNAYDVKRTDIEFLIGRAMANVDELKKLGIVKGESDKKNS